MSPSRNEVDLGVGPSLLADRLGASPCLPPGAP